MNVRSKRMNQLFLLLGISILLAVSSCSKDDPTSPPPDVEPGEGETEQIGNEGGTVMLGDASITVPSGYLPESLPFTLTKKKSFTEDATYTLDPAAYQPMGVAYQLDTPLRSSVPLTLTIYYDAQKIPTGYDAANLGVVQRVTGYPERLAGNERSTREPEVRYLTMPAVVSPDTGAVAFELFGSGIYQLVAMSEPVDTYRFTIGGAQANGSSRAGEPEFEIAHLKPPAVDPVGFNTLVEEAIRAAYAKYQSMGFTLPKGLVRILTVEFSDPLEYGSVPPEDPLRIELNYRLATPDAIRITVSHEYFHCIQYFNSNLVSTETFWDEDTWFVEGSADWAADEVYDAIPGHYDAPTAARFKTSLDAIPSPNDGYDTIAFWKWLEAKNPGTMRSIFDQQRLITSREPVSVLWVGVINTNATSYEASLREVRPNVPFLLFFRSSLFHKDYEQDEILVDGTNEDLWGPHKLGPPRKLAPGLPEAGRITTLRKGEPGESEENPRSVDYVLDQKLATDVFAIRNTPGENALEGTLHVKFEPDTYIDYEAAVIAYKDTSVVDESTVTVFGTGDATTTVAFDQDTEVAVIVVNPNWNDTGRGTSQCEVWVAEDSPCGELEEPILEIDNVEDLVAALESPPSGGTIRLAPGTYYPPSREWDDVVDPQYDKRWANLMLNGVTLAGSTEGETRIVLMRNPENVNIGIFVQGNACVRDLTIDGSADNNYIFEVDNVLEFELCNVTITDNSHEVGNTIIFYQPWDPGTFNISVYDCVIACPSYVSGWYYGIDLSPFRWDWSGGPAPIINFELKKTKFYNLGCGVGFNNSDPENRGTVVVDTDCYFFSNVDHNVYDWGSQTDICP